MYVVKPVAERLANKSTFEPNTGCLLWTGGVSSNGYGTIGLRGKVLSTHRLSWELVNGPIPSGLYVCHRCDTPACINVDHLFLGTAKDNVTDKVQKGRQRYPGHKIKTHCVRGHELTEENVYRYGPRQGRSCRACSIDSGKARYAAKKEKRDHV